MLAHEVQESNWESLYGERSNYPVDIIHELNAGDEKSSIAKSETSSSAMESWFARFNTSYDGRYYATFTIRADGSSKFGTNNKWGYFPSVALAWRISQESFLKEVEKIDNLKLRLSWGKVGNQNFDNYLYVSKLRPVPTMNGTGFLAYDLANPNLRWEETESYNVGLDLALFNGRIEFIAEAYIKQTKDLIIQIPPTLYSGISDEPYGKPGTLNAPFVNAGSVQNKGIELTLNSVNIDYRKFKWRSGITFTLNRGEVKNLNTPSGTFYGKDGTELISITRVGGPVGCFYGYVAEGLFISEADFYTFDKDGNKKPVAIPKGKEIGHDGIWVGDVKWKDINGDGIIDEKDRTIIGDPNPKFTYGITNTFSYKNIDLTIDLQGVYGNDIYNGLRQQYEYPSGNKGLLKGVSNYAQIGQVDPNLPDGNTVLSNVYVVNQGHSIPRISNENANTNNRMSDLYIEDGSFLRIKNISVGYNMPKKLVNRYHIEAMRFYVNFQNLYTFTNYSGYDPEVGLYKNRLLLNGYDNGRYPSPRIYTFGLNLTL
jgi:TonB-linked SusC/RagA family outer membrane protein